MTAAPQMHFRQSCPISPNSPSCDPGLLWIGLLLAGGGMVGRPDPGPARCLQGETVRILSVHVPAAWLGMAGWTVIAAARWPGGLASSAGRGRRAGGRPRRRDLRRHLPRDRLDLGRPAWGTWWEWDGRLTSILVMLFLYFGDIALPVGL